MKKFKITGFRYGVWCEVTITTIFECVTDRAAEYGIDVITNVEEV